MKEVTKAWAIIRKEHNRSCFLRGCNDNQNTSLLFKTREQARDYCLPRTRDDVPQERVIRVKVTVETE